MRRVRSLSRRLLCFPCIRSRMLSMQRATPWFVGPAIHGARAAQLLSRSRAHSRERARRAHTSAQQIDAQRSRLIAHSLSRLECRLPLMASTPLGHSHQGVGGSCGSQVPRALSAARGFPSAIFCWRLSRAPGVPSRICQNPGPGPRAGECGRSMQQQEKASGFAIQLSSNSLSSKAASLRGRPVFPCLLCVPTTKMPKTNTAGPLR